MLNEFIVDDRLEEVQTTVYHGGTSTKVKARKHRIGVDGATEISDYKVETAGKFVAPFGTLIPAAGQLMLAIAERLAADRGLTFAFCDTDSMAFCDYHKRYTREQFRAKVQEIRYWFQPLNPYKHDVPIFNLEKVNYRLKDHETGKITKEREPLYCLAVSAKRYSLFNRDKDGTPIIRKASARGLGDVTLPAGYKPKFEHIAAPIEKDDNDQIVIDDITKEPKRQHSGSAAPLFLDMWYAAITELDEKGTLEGIDKIIGVWPELNLPQHSQTSLSTRDAWLKYPSLPNRRAFQFMTTLPAPILLNPTEIKVDPSKPRILPHERREAEKHSLYMPFTRPFKLDLENLYRRDTNELIAPFLEGGLELVTVAQRVAGYFAHGEAKSQGTTGLLSRKCVAGLSKVWICKESHALANVEDLPDDETLETYKTDTIITAELSCNGDLIKHAGIDRVAKAARIDKAMLCNAVQLGSNLPLDALARIANAINITPEGTIDVIDVPLSRQETAEERVRHILTKGGRLRELARFIHSDLVLKDPDNPPN